MVVVDGLNLVIQVASERVSVWTDVTTIFQATVHSVRQYFLNSFELSVFISFLINLGRHVFTRHLFSGFSDGLVDSLSYVTVILGFLEKTLR